MRVACSSSPLHGSTACYIRLAESPEVQRLFSYNQLECGPMPNVMAALPNIGGALCSTPQSLADAQTRVQGCPKLANRSQPLVGRSSLYYQDMWRRYCCLTSFFPIVDTCLSSEDIARQSCAMIPKWRFFASCISSEPLAAHFRPAF